MKRIITDISQWTALTLLVMARWKKKSTPFMVIIKASPKTHEQLGYFHSTVLPPFTQIMFDSGEIEKNNERHAKYYIKRAIGFGEWIEYGGGKVFDPFSFSDADTEVLSSAIDYSIEQAQLRGLYISPPKTNNKEKK